MICIVNNVLEYGLFGYFNKFDCWSIGIYIIVEKFVLWVLREDR